MTCKIERAGSTKQNGVTAKRYFIYLLCQILLVTASLICVLHYNQQSYPRNALKFQQNLPFHPAFTYHIFGEHSEKDFLLHTYTRTYYYVFLVCVLLFVLLYFTLQ